MPFPETVSELVSAGYVFQDDSHCTGCGEPIEWWKTPKGKLMPIDVDSDGNCESHFATCKKAQDFRKK